MPKFSLNFYMLHCLKSESEAIETFQRKATLVCTGTFRITNNDRLLNELCWEKM